MTGSKTCKPVYLNQKKQVRTAQKKKGQKRPTKQFLDHFGLSKIEDLPPLEEIKIEEIEETDLFESKYVPM